MPENTIKRIENVTELIQVYDSELAEHTVRFIDSEGKVNAQIGEIDNLNSLEFQNVDSVKSDYAQTRIRFREPVICIHSDEGYFDRLLFCGKKPRTEQQKALWNQKSAETYRI